MARGFTLTELIIVMVILAILAIGASSYLGIGARMYSEASEREQLLSSGRFAAERLVRELRGAAPNSVRIAQSAGIHCLEFAPIVSSGLYQQLPIFPDSDKSLQLLHMSWQDDFLLLPFAVYPVTPADIYSMSGAKVFCDDEMCDEILEVDANAEFGTIEITFVEPLSFPRSSPEQRFYILAESPTSFCYNALTQELRRYQGYAYLAAQPLPPVAAGILMAKNVRAVSFTAVPASLSRNSVVNVMLRFGASNVDDLYFNYEVHIPNVP